MSTPARRSPARPRTVLLAALLAALLLAACAGDSGAGGDGLVVEPGGDPGPSATDPEPTSVATTAEPTQPGQLTVTGVLSGSDLEGGCVWVDTDDGTRYELIASPTSDVAIDPANQVVADSSGAVIAQAGDEIEVTGSVDTGMMTFCQVGENLVVESISAR